MFETQKKKRTKDDILQVYIKFDDANSRVLQKHEAFSIFRFVF